MSKQRTGKTSSPSNRPRPAASARTTAPLPPSGAPNDPPPPPTRLAPLAVPSAPAAPVEDARRAARMERQSAAQAAAAKRRQQRMLRNIGLVAAVVLVLGGLIGAWAVNEANKPGEAVSQQPSPHLTAATDTHAPYSTDPPTSGPHVPEVPPWGISTAPLVNELAVHGLEDKGVIISYKPDLDAPTIKLLQDLVNSYQTELIVAPHPNLSNAIVLTAWGRIQRMDKYDDKAIRRFIDAYRGIDHHKDSGS